MNSPPSRKADVIFRAEAVFTLDLYSHVLPGMQEDAATKVDAALEAALNKRETK